MTPAEVATMCFSSATLTAFGAETAYERASASFNALIFNDFYAQECLKGAVYSGKHDICQLLELSDTDLAVKAVSAGVMSVFLTSLTMLLAFEGCKRVFKKAFT